MADKNGKSTFWKVYKISLIAASIIVALLLVYLTMILKDYEEAQPKHVAEQTFADYFENFDADEFARQFSENGGYEDADEVAKVLRQMTSGKEIKYYRVSTGMDQSYKYIVKAGDEKFASFKLVEDTEAQNRFKTYKSTDFQLFLNAGESVTVEVPRGYKLFLNGKEIGEDDIVQKDIKTDASVHMPEGVEGILYNKYTVSGLLTEPEIKVTDENGKEANVAEKNGTYRADVIYTDSLKNEYHEWIMKGMKRYAEYMQHSSNNPVTFGEISVYFDPSSDLYEDIKTEENMFVWDYDSVEYENDDTGEYIKYDDNTFSCRVKFVQVLHKYGEEDYKDHLDLTLYLRKVDGQFLIYDMGQN